MPFLRAVPSPQKQTVCAALRLTGTLNNLADVSRHPPLPNRRPPAQAAFVRKGRHELSACLRGSWKNFLHRSSLGRSAGRAGRASAPLRTGSRKPPGPWARSNLRHRRHEKCAHETHSRGERSTARIRAARTPKHAKCTGITRLHPYFTHHHRSKRRAAYLLP